MSHPELFPIPLGAVDGYFVQHILSARGDIHNGSGPTLDLVHGGTVHYRLQAAVGLVLALISLSSLAKRRKRLASLYSQSHGASHRKTTRKRFSCVNFELLGAGPTFAREAWARAETS